MSNNFKLHLSSGRTGAELWATEFVREGVLTKSVRGKTGLSWEDSGSFQWTSAVKALTLLACLTHIYNKPFILQGGANSLASSLDYAVSKRPDWTIDMFGQYPSGLPVVKRLVKQLNPGRRMGESVGVTISPHILLPDFISVTVDRRLLNKDQLAVIVRSWLQNEKDYHMFQGMPEELIAV